MSKKKPKAATVNGRPQRYKLSAEESLRRMQDFDKRKEAFIAKLRRAVIDALQEEAVLVVAVPIYHVE